MRILSCLVPLAVVALSVLSACSKKADVKSQVAELEEAFQAPAPATASQPEKGVLSQGLPADANAYVNLALSAVRTNDYAGGVNALQAVQRMPGITANQLMAVERAKEAMTSDLVARAARGDAKAKAELAVIEKTRSQ
jgi:hypothetical protein